jgi:ABC-type sulfate transport system permease component
VPLAWGAARRTGRAWLAGLVVGPIVAALLREMQQRWEWWNDHVTFSAYSWSWILQAVAFVAPFVLAVLACWALEARTTSPTRV